VRPEVVHISPVMFGEGGYWGGGERYPLELARAHAELVPTRLVAFGRRPQRRRLGALELVVVAARARWRGSDLNPLSREIVRATRSARIIHVHQFHTFLTDLCLLAGAALRRPVYVTDHGGWAPNLGRLLPRRRLIARLLAVSGYSASLFPELDGRSSVIYGGVDTKRFRPPEPGQRDGVVFVGRLLPHKGVDVLIEAVDASVPLSIYGRPYDRSYRRALEQLARGKHVTFHENAGDEQIVRAYQSARAVVLPTVPHSRYGPSSVKAELFGLTQVEAMACATPVVCSDVGPLPEVAVDGHTGYVVPAGDAVALGDRLRALCADDALWERMSAGALERVRERFTWEQVARRALDAYRGPI
jgi:glycosyltransferase involved in cell wall biosynthesis